MPILGKYLMKMLINRLRMLLYDRLWKEGIFVKVTIQKELSDYMHAHHHNTISLRLIHDDIGVGNMNSIHPRIRYKVPKHTERFDKFVVEDFDIYVEKGIEAKEETIEFIHEKMFGVHRCHVRGINLDFAELHH